MNKMKKVFGIAGILLAAVSAVCNYRTINLMHDGYIVFLDKIYGAQNYDISIINNFVLLSRVLAAAFVLSLIYAGIMLIRKNSGKKQTAEAVFLVILLLTGKLLYCRLAAPTELLTAIAKGETPEKIIGIANKRCNNINAVREGFSALTLAITNDREPRVIKALIENGADVNARMPVEDDPAFIHFLFAVSNKQDKSKEDEKIDIETVKAFLNSGVDVNAQTYMGVTPVTSVIGANTNTEILQVIIDAGADINHQTLDPISGDKSVSALMIAAFDGSSPETAKTLIENGADLKAITGSGVTMLIAAANHDKNIELVRTIIEDGADVNAQTTRGTTALMSAARNNEGAEIIKRLLDNGADRNIKDNNGNTAFDHLKTNTKLSKENKEKVSKLLK